MSSLSLLPLLPFLGALAVLLTPSAYRAAWRYIAIAATGITVLVAVSVFFGFQVGYGGYQMVANHAWVPAIGLNYHVGVDGISVGLLLVA